MYRQDGAADVPTWRTNDYARAQQPNIVQQLEPLGRAFHAS
jgi:hypothetical protein